MMKQKSRTGKLLGALVLLVCMVFAMSVMVLADAKVPSRVRVFPRSYDDNAIEMTLPEHGAEIKNIKVNKGGLVARVTRYDDYRPSENSSSDEDLEANIGIYAKKTGKYKVSFDFYSAEDKKISSHTVTVFVKSDSPVKSFTYGGKEREYLENIPASGRVKVVMNKGYTLKNLEMGSYKRKKTEDGYSSEIVYKTIRNGAKITLSKNPYYYEYSYGKLSDKKNSYSFHMNKNILAYTYIRITYKDKWTKLTDTRSYSLSQLSKE